MLNLQDEIRACYPGSQIGYYPLDELTGSTIYDRSGNGHNGTVSGATLGDAEGPDGRPCIYFDGLNDYIELESSGILADIDTEEGTMGCYGKVYDNGVWSDEATRYMTLFERDSDNQIRIIKRGGGSSFYNMIQFLHKGNGIIEYNNYDTTALTDNLDWIFCVMTWSKTGNYTKMYANGILVDTDNYSDDFTGACDDCTIGNDETHNYPYYGWLSNAFFLNKPIEQGFIQQFAIGRLD